MKFHLLVLCFLATTAYTTNAPADFPSYIIPPVQDPEILPPTNGTSTAELTGIVIGSVVGAIILAVGGTAVTMYFLVPVAPPGDPN